MNLDSAATIPVVVKNDRESDITRGSGLDGLVLRARAASLREAAEPPGLVSVAAGPQQPVNRNDDKMADDTISVAVHYTLVAPEIEGDDDGELAIPGALPMQVQLYVDFPAAAIAHESRAAITGSASVSAASSAGHAGRSGNEAWASTVDASRDATEGLLSTAGLNARWQAAHAAAPFAQAQSEAASVPSSHYARAGLEGQATFSLGKSGSNPDRQAASFFEARKKNDTAGAPHSVHGPALTPTPPVHSAIGIPDAPTAQGASSHTRYEIATSAEHAGEPQTGSADTAGAAETVTLEKSPSDKVEMTYRFASWGPGHSVQLNLDRVHPGAHMLAAASSGQVHRVLADALDQTRQGAKDRPALRLTLDAVDDSGERADEQEGQRWP